MGTPITIHNLDDATVERLRVEALQRGVDVSVIARESLMRGLPTRLPQDVGVAPFHDLDAFAGTWTDAEADEFLASIGDFGRVDPDQW
jgi:plasmid stability protein